ncbi:MAG: aldolase/citrate lyase family protein, partial [Chlorobium sp.]
MNVLEVQMVEVLEELRDDYGVFEIKAEFEAEGSRIEEMMRLKDVTSKVNLPIILKIGGVEAVTDIYNAISIGVKGVIAPMAETAFAVSKFLNAIETFVAEDNRKDIDFAINIETITAFNNLDSILALPNISILQGVTIGRVDFVGSMG